MCVKQTAARDGAKAISRARRKKLWQLDGHFHCSVIGTCLTLDELRRLCRKVKINSEGKVSDYDLHRAFVGIAGQSCHSTRLLNKYLDQKYRRSLEAVTKAGEALPAFWQTALDTGEVAGAYWALVTHPGTPKELLDRIYGEVHMLSHLAGASTRVDLRTLDRLRRRVQELEHELAAAKTQGQRQLTEKNTLQAALDAHLIQAEQTERTLQETQAKLTALEQEPLVEHLQVTADDLSAQLSEACERAERALATANIWERAALRAEDHNRRLEQQLLEANQETAALEAMLERLLPLDCAAPCQDEHEALNCPNADLCGRHVLYVGGRIGQYEQLRLLVERHNGRFLYHDGGREECKSRLSAILSQADAVLCPLDCVSHDAVKRVKRFCESQMKPLVLLPRASLSAFARGLVELAL